jgi:hypothetical protein
VLLPGEQPVHEDALRFVAPKPADVLRVDLVLISPADAHHEFPEVAQIENIVNLRGSWQELLQALIIKLYAILQKRRDLFCL